MAKSSELNEKLDKIILNEETILENEKKILKKENKIEAEEKVELENGHLELNEEMQVLKELSKLEDSVENEFSHPLKEITKKDVLKGFIGAFLGVMGHFAFIYANKVAGELTFLNSTILYVVAFGILIAMLYYTGFRKIEKHLLISILPLRAVILFLVSIITILFVNLLFGKISIPIDFLFLYNMVGASIILAVIGAGTADLIGKN